MKIDADDNNVRGFRLPTPTYGTRPIYTAFAGYSNNERLLCFLFVHSRMRRDNAPDNDRPTHWTAKDPRGSTAVMNFKISLAAFGVKP
jgi:hypothetical protein